eukprot:1761092-Alexandrium_andersonii.AAC.1
MDVSARPRPDIHQSELAGRTCRARTMTVSVDLARESPPPPRQGQTSYAPEITPVPTVRASEGS